MDGAAMTPEKAKTLWCPFARASGFTSEQAEGNRDDKGEPRRSCYCITTHCMAWGEIKETGMRGATATPIDEQGYCLLMLKS